MTKLVECKFCGKMVPSDMIGVRWDKSGPPYLCCTMCCGVKKSEEKI